MGGSNPDPGKSTRGCTPTKYRTYHNFSHPYEATAGSVVRAEIELILEEEFASVSVKNKKVIMENAEAFKLPQIEFPYGNSMQFFPKVRNQRELLVFTYKTGLLKACLQFLGHHTSAFLNATDKSIPSFRAPGPKSPTLGLFSSVYRYPRKGGQTQDTHHAKKSAT